MIEHIEGSLIPKEEQIAQIADALDFLEYSLTEIADNVYVVEGIPPRKLNAAYDRLCYICRDVRLDDGSIILDFNRIKPRPRDTRFAHGTTNGRYFGMYLRNRKSRRTTI